MRLVFLDLLYLFICTLGISASSGRPLSPPIDFRIVARPSPKKTERAAVQEAKCHKCLRWVAVETVKDVDVKVRDQSSLLLLNLTKT